jgi:hypothetical protein
MAAAQEDLATASWLRSVAAAALGQQPAASASKGATGSAHSAKTGTGASSGSSSGRPNASVSSSPDEDIDVTLGAISKEVVKSLTSFLFDHILPSGPP